MQLLNVSTRHLGNKTALKCHIVKKLVSILYQNYFLFM